MYLTLPSLPSSLLPPLSSLPSLPPFLPSPFLSPFLPLSLPSSLPLYLSFNSLSPSLPRLLPLHTTNTLLVRQVNKSLPSMSQCWSSQRTKCIATSSTSLRRPHGQVSVCECVHAYTCTNWGQIWCICSRIDCVSFSLPELELTNLVPDVRTRVTIHSVQLLPQKAFREHESFETLALEPEARGEMVISVVVGTHTCK